VVEPVDPCEGGEFEVVEPSPWSPVADQFGLVKTDERSARALSYESPREATEATTPFSASRSVYRIDRYCTPYPIDVSARRVRRRSSSVPRSPAPTR
jgi:hypothetical protein